MPLKGLNHPVMWVVVAILASTAAAVVRGQTSPGLLIDDFASAGQASTLGTKWTFQTGATGRDNVAAKLEFVEEDGRTRLHLKGTVPPGGKGAYLEARLGLGPDGRNFNAQGYSGIRLRVKGNGSSYAVRLRTKDTPFSGQYYEAAFPTDGSWQEVNLLFRQFHGASLRMPADSAALRTVGIVAAGKGQTADLYVENIGLYREDNMYKDLTPEEQRVIVHKGTERPFTGKYDSFFQAGTYTCKRCGARLFDSASKFDAHCGWPSFDEQIAGAVRWQPDRNSVFTEIVCANCGGHLGHVFLGERLTAKNTRYCVNSISMNFIPAVEMQRPADPAQADIPRTETAIFASGCFWGTQYHLQRAAGVISTTVGYIGGHVDSPTYEQVCTDTTGHAEAVKVVFDPTKTSFGKLARLFFETHDFTQVNRQGPDIGRQYRSAIFYLNDEQRQDAMKMVSVLTKAGYRVATEVTAAGEFWPAEDYHQDYYAKTGNTPYCHVYRPIAVLEAATTK